MTFKILFEPSTQKYYEGEYEFTPRAIVDLKVGDEIFNDGWLKDRTNHYERIIKNGWQFIIKENRPDLRTLKVIRKGSPNLPPLTYGYSSFGNRWLVKELRTLQYDPLQQGDTDDDI